MGSDRNNLQVALLKILLVLSYNSEEKSAII